MAEVLVIENNRKPADLFAKDLRLAGFRVDTSVGSSQGITNLCDHQYEKIIINPFFGDGSADDMLEMLKKVNMLNLVLVCSADQERVKRSIEQDIVAVAKPIPFLHLSQLVSHIIRTAPVQA